MHWHVVGRAESASMEEAARDYNPKETFYAQVEADHTGVFSGP